MGKVLGEGLGCEKTFHMKLDYISDNAGLNDTSSV